MNDETFSKLKLNAVIKVKLNESGIAILRDEHNYYKSKIASPSVAEKFGDFIEPETDEDGYSEMKLWQFMHTFGNYCFYEGTQEDERWLPFDPEILINNSSLVLVEKKQSKKLKK